MTKELEDKIFDWICTAMKYTFLASLFLFFGAIIYIFFTDGYMQDNSKRYEKEIRLKDSCKLCMYGERFSHINDT